MKVLLSVPMNRPPVAEVNINDNGLGFVAAAFKQAGADVSLFSWNVNLKYDAFRAKIKEIQPDIFGLKVFTMNFVQAYETLRVVRETLPNVITIIGGPHPSTSRAEDLFAEFGDLIDFAIAGDGEYGVMELTKLIKANGGKPAPGQLSNVPGLIYQNGKAVKFNKRNFNVDVDTLPQQDWDLQPPYAFSRNVGAGVDPETLDFQGIGKGNHPASQKSVLYQDSRGCHKRCGHCMSWIINGPNARKHQLKRVIQELDMLIYKYGARVFEFTGNELFKDIEYVKALCNWLISLDVPIRWGCTGGPNAKNLANPELLDLMRRAGCTTIHFGVESGSPAVRRREKKTLPLSKVTEIVKLATSKGIKVEGGFMFGFKDETVEEMNETIRYAFSVPFSKLAFVICLPIPSSPGYKAILRKYGLKRIDWSTYDFNKPNLLPCKATIGQVRRTLLKAKILRKFRWTAWLYRKIHKLDDNYKSNG